jgi:phosphoglycolate phosphatase
MNVFNYKAVFFDLDGTLLDSAQDLSFALNIMADELNIDKPSLLDVKRWIGNGTFTLVEKSLIQALDEPPSADYLNKAFEIFSNAYKEFVGEYSQLFPGVKELFVKLLSHNIKIVCITNKPLEFTDFLLQINMISQFFSIICAGDNVKFKKPHPWPLLYASESLKVPIEDCLMVGDSKQDIEAAREAGCDVIAVSYGYNHGEDIKTSNPDGVIDSFTQLYDL